MVYLKLFPTRSLHIIIKIININFLPATSKTTNNGRGSRARCIRRTLHFSRQFLLACSACTHTYTHMGQVNDLLYSRRLGIGHAPNCVLIAVRYTCVCVELQTGVPALFHTSQVSVSDLPSIKRGPCRLRTRGSDRL